MPEAKHGYKGTNLNSLYENHLIEQELLQKSLQPA